MQAFTASLSPQVTHSSHSFHTVTTHHALHILQRILECLSSNTEHSDARRSQLTLQNDAFKQ